jgi:hypothetical protein
MQDAGVSEKSNPGSLGPIDHRAVLSFTLANVAPRDEQEPLYALEGPMESLRTVVIECSDIHAQGRKIREFYRVASQRHNLGGLNPSEKRFESKASKAPRSSGDCVHGQSPKS